MEGFFFYSAEWPTLSPARTSGESELNRIDCCAWGLAFALACPGSLLVGQQKSAPPHGTLFGAFSVAQVSQPGAGLIGTKRAKKEMLLAGEAGGLPVCTKHAPSCPLLTRDEGTGG